MIKNDPAIINCFSVDVEGFVESNVENFRIDKKYTNSAKENYEVEKNMDFTLGLLNEYNIRATFFFLGRMAQDVAGIIKSTALLGHEIACHGQRHEHVFASGKEKFKNDISRAKKSLEDVSGKPVRGFRAPDFSITKLSLWAFDILKEAGFLYDSSVYPFTFNNVSGIKSRSPFIHRLANGLTEFPLSTIDFFSIRFPFCGSGYFRLFPVSLTSLFVSRINDLGHPCMFYIHPYELGPVIPVIPELSPAKKIRHYYNRKSTQQKLKKIVKEFKFAPAIEILNDKGPDASS